MPAGKIIQSSFKPAWWLPGGHLQTLWPYLFRRLQKPLLVPERLELPDGDFVDLCWSLSDDGPVIAVFHGLEGNISSAYADGIMSMIQKIGWRGVFMHFRGCSGEPNRLQRSYHSGDTGDIEFLLNTVKERFPATPVGAIGFSLGGNALLKYLGETGTQNPLSAAAAVSVPYLLEDGAQRLSRGVSRLYQWRLVRSLQNKVRTKFRLKKPPYPLHKLNELDTFASFDEHITAPLNGFRDAKDYYSRSSSRQYLSKICVPTLLIHAWDDPFMTQDSVPDTSELSDSVTFELSKSGGHVGFIGGFAPWKVEYWLDSRIIEFFTSLLR